MRDSQIMIFLDGQYQKIGRSKLDTLAPGVVSDDGVFETMLIYQRQMIDFDSHWKRMEQGLKLLGRKALLTQQQAKQVMEELVEKNKLTVARVRIAMWRDGKQKRISIVAVPQEMLSDRDIQKGLKGCVSSVVRNRTRTSHIKSMDYALFRRAYEVASDQGYDEAVLFNAQGFLVEGTRTNIFFIKNKELFTPAIYCGCLSGITRRKIIKIAKAQAMKCYTGKWTSKDLMTADEVFLTNSGGGILPVTSIDKIKIGTGLVGEETLRLRQIYQEYIQNYRR